MEEGIERLRELDMLGEYIMQGWDTQKMTMLLVDTIYQNNKECDGERGPTSLRSSLVDAF